MAEIEEALVKYLLAQTGLTDLISSKLFPEEIPMGTTLPAVSYINVSDVKLHILTGQDGLERPFIQFTVMSLTKAATRLVANQIEVALKDYVGTLSGIVIQYIRLENKMSNLETSNDGTVKVYTEDLEFQINFERS